VYNTTRSHGCICCSHDKTTYLTDSISDLHLQIPLLRGSNKLEKMAYRLSWIAGKSGKHLFLKDIEDQKPPLLLQMVTDYGGLHFMSAVRPFKRRVAYSNVCNDFIVGWRTSSIRRQHELPKVIYPL